MSFRIRPVGTRAALVEVGTTADVHRLLRALEAHPVEGIEEVVAGARSVLVICPGGADPAAVAALVAGRWPPPSSGADVGDNRHFRVPVVYDGPDLEGVAAAAGLSVDEVVGRHAAGRYTVDFLGFSPGFAYLSGADPALAVPRLPSPRPSVPAGSVALAAGMTAVYPQATPGGWRIIGRTDAVMFDPSRRPPALLAPGDRVTFQPVDRLDGPAPKIAARPIGVPRPGSQVAVVWTGGQVTVQDGGRIGWAGMGVSRAGFADRRSAEAANALVGNDPYAALLEVTFGGCRLQMLADRAVAVTGADCDVSVDGIPARRDTALPLPGGAELAVGPSRRGLRVYIAFAGGVEVEPVLGSRATDTLSGLGPAPVTAGDLLPLGPPPRGAVPAGVVGGTRLPAADSGPVVLRIRLGPRDDWLAPAGRTRLLAQPYTITPRSDRTGVRLEGPPVELVAGGDLLSEGMVAGAVQIPSGGQPIVFLRNHPPTGGYPVVAVVDDGGVDLLAQCRPGDTVRFVVA